MARSHELIVQKILEYIRANLSEPLDLAKIAEQVNCSKSWLFKIFIKQTGKSPVAHLAAFRIQKAKELLRHTDLTVSEISAAAGFDSPGYFGIAFKKAEKQSPTQFRNGARALQPAKTSSPAGEGIARPWFLDSMAVNALAGRWRPLQGEWNQETGCVCGRGEEEYALELARLLPDNFHLSFEMKLENIRGVTTSPFRIHLCDQANGSDSYEIILHDLFGAEYVLLREGLRVAEGVQPRIREGTWHRISLALNDEEYSLRIDGEETLSFRDPFPTIYDRRCRLRISGHQSRLRLRNVQIDDLGFLPFARAIRQADALYNAGLLAQAGHFYERMLQTRSSPADINELSCKIGLCCLKQGDYAAAREWVQKVPPLPATDFWAQQAALVLLEIDWREDKVEEMRARMQLLARWPQIRCRIRGIVQQAAADFDSRGFFEEALLLRTSLYDIEEPATAQALGDLALICESLFQLNRLDSAITHLKELAIRGRAIPRASQYWLFTLVDAYNTMGNAVEARRVLQEIRQFANDEGSQARCDVYEAFCMQTEGVLNKELELLRSVPAKYPRAGRMSAFALLSASSILVSLGRPNEALETISEAEKMPESLWFLNKGRGSRHRYPPLLAKGEYGRAAEILLADSQVENSSLARHAQQALQAALILALAGKKGESSRILGDIQKRFPEIRVRYYATLAGALKQAIENSATPGWAAAIASTIENLPYPVRERCEMLYLSGMLFMNSGEVATGRRLLSRIAQEDHSNGWPAVLARKLLQESESTSERPQ